MAEISASQVTLNTGIVNKGVTIPVQAWTGPDGCSRLWLPKFQDNRYTKVVRLSALHTLSQVHGVSIKNSNDTIGNRTGDPPPGV